MAAKRTKRSKLRAGKAKSGKAAKAKVSLSIDLDELERLYRKIHGLLAEGDGKARHLVLSDTGSAKNLRVRRVDGDTKAGARGRVRRDDGDTKSAPRARRRRDGGDTKAGARATRQRLRGGGDSK